MPDRPVLFLPECHADTALIRFLFPDHKMSIHEQGCPEVAKAMLSPRANEYNLIGIVDNDKKLNMHCKGFFAKFEYVDQRDKLLVKKHPDTNQFIVVVDKAIESFLLWNAELVGVDVGQYGFNIEVKRFGLQLKTPTIETDSNYLQLLVELHARQAPGFITLERILNALITT
ncbi:hypothetical protein GCM10028807_24700 [Spirosoma daeguense]